MSGRGIARKNHELPSHHILYIIIYAADGERERETESSCCTTILSPSAIVAAHNNITRNILLIRIYYNYKISTVNGRVRSYNNNNNIREGGESVQFIRPDEGGGGGRCLPGATYNPSGAQTRVAVFRWRATTRQRAAPVGRLPRATVDNVPLCVQYNTHTHTHTLPRLLFLSRSFAHTSQPLCSHSHPTLRFHSLRRRR